MTDPILETDGLTRRFGDETAVDGVSLAVESGEFFSLVGPSGCGKTTTLRMLAGLETPTGGTVRIGGREVTDRPARERDTNLVFQDLVLFPHMTVAENVGYGLARRGVPAARRRRRVTEILETVDLAGAGDRDPTELSGGQRQRVALARGLVNEPAVLLLDEPLSSLDRKLRQEMRGELRRIQREVGTTFLYVTHDQESAMSMSDRVAVMHDGAVVEVGPPERLYGRPRTAFVADFLGDANLLAAEVVDRDGAAVTVEAGGGRFGADTNGSGPTVGEEVTVMVRPEDLRAGGDALVGEVRNVEYKGFYEEYRVVLDDPAGRTEVRARNDGDRRLTVGDRVGFDVADAAVVADRGVGADADGHDAVTDPDRGSRRIEADPDAGAGHGRGDGTHGGEP